MKTPHQLLLMALLLIGPVALNAACNTGDTADQIRCLLVEFCPNPAGESERIACFEMITSVVNRATAKQEAAHALTMTTSRSGRGNRNDRSGVDGGPGWSEIVFVRPQPRGTELIVLDNGEMWVEDKKNPIFAFKKHDLVQVTEGILLRKDGTRAKVSATSCGDRKVPKSICKRVQKLIN